MNKKLVLVIEVMVSMAIVISMYLVGVYVKPKEKIIQLKHLSVERRDRFLDVATPVDKPDVLWLVGKEGKILRSEDGGKVWNVQTSGTSENLQSIAAWDSQHAVVVGNTGLILVTADGGKTWRPVAAPKSEMDNKLLRVRIDSQGAAWTVGIIGAVLVSNDFGNTWERKVPEQDIAWNDVAFSPQGDVWIVGEFGYAMHLAASGSKPVAIKTAAPTTTGANVGGHEEKKFSLPTGWIGTKMPTDRSLMSIAFSDPQHAVIGGVEGTLLTSDDGGATWKIIPLATKDHIFDMTFVDRRWLGVGGRGLMIEGDAAGARWQVGRVQTDDYAWHTVIAAFQDKLLIAGATLIERSQKDLRLHGNDQVATGQTN